MSSKAPPDELATANKELVCAYNALEKAKRRYKHASTCYETTRAVFWWEHFGYFVLVVLFALLLSELFLDAKSGPLHLILCTVRLAKSIYVGLAQ